MIFDDVFMQAQTKQEMFEILDKRHRICLKNMKEAPDKPYFFLLW